MGAVAWHPTFYSHFYTPKYTNLTFWERIREIYLEWRIFQRIKSSEEYDANKLRKRFGSDIPTLEDMKKNIDVMFVNSHSLFASNRPVPSNVLYLGALHLQEVKTSQQVKLFVNLKKRFKSDFFKGTSCVRTVIDLKLI